MFSTAHYVVIAFFAVDSSEDFKAPYTRKRFPAFFYCLLFSRESGGEQPAHYLEQYKNARKRFRVYRAQMYTS